MDATAWSLVGLILFLALVLYLKVPAMVTKGLDERSEKIRKDLDEARELREEAQNLLAEYQAKRQAAEKEAEGALEQITDKAYETVLVDGQTEVRRIGIVFSTKGYVMKEEKYSYPTQEVKRMDTVTRSAALSEEKTATKSRGTKRGRSGTQAASPGAAREVKGPRRSGRSRRGASTQAVTGAAAE